MHPTLGGVGRNVAEALDKLGQRGLLLTAVGDDFQGQLIANNTVHMVRLGLFIF